MEELLKAQPIQPSDSSTWNKKVPKFVPAPSAGKKTSRKNIKYWEELRKGRYSRNERRRVL